MIPSPRFTSENVEEELELTKPYTSGDISAAIKGSSQLSFYSTDLAGYAAWSFQWNAPKTIGFVPLAPTYKGAGIILQPDGYIRHYYDPSTRNMGRWITYAAADTDGNKYQAKWTSTTNGITPTQESTWYTLNQEFGFVLGSGVGISSAQVVLSFRKVGHASADYSVSLALVLGEAY